MLLAAYPLVKAHLFEPSAMLGAHVRNAEAVGLGRYLRMKQFIHSNTDGPDNPFARGLRRPPVADRLSRLRRHEDLPAVHARATDAGPRPPRRPHARLAPVGAPAAGGAPLVTHRAAEVLPQRRGLPHGERVLRRLIDRHERRRSRIAVGGETVALMERDVRSRRRALVGRPGRIRAVVREQAVDSRSRPRCFSPNCAGSRLNVLSWIDDDLCLPPAVVDVRLALPGRLCALLAVATLG